MAADPKLKPGQNDNARPEMTAEEKKAQRAAKAAEKKARAEVAIAKKQAASNQTPPSAAKAAATAQKAEVVTKSSLKSGHSSSRTGEKSVKFGLSPTSMRGSEENLPAVTEGIPPPSPANAEIHPAFLTLAIRCEMGEIYDVDGLCINFLDAFIAYLDDWLIENEGIQFGDISHALHVAIQPQIGHLTENGKWALPPGLGNLVRQMKREILQMNLNKDQKSAIEALRLWLSNCRSVNFELAYRGIADHLAKKLTCSKKVITYDWYPAVEKVLLNCPLNGLSCCVVDSELNGRGIQLAKILSSNDITTQYTDLVGVSSAIVGCSMMILGCSAVLSSGNVVAVKGSLPLALMAKAYNVPVIILAQSFKFVDKVQSVGRVALLRRETDEIIPSDLITALITDIRVLPPSSAPAVLKSKALDMQ